MADQAAIAPEMMHTPTPERPEQLQSSIRSFFASPEAQKFFGVEVSPGQPTRTMGLGVEEISKIRKDGNYWLTFLTDTGDFLAKDPPNKSEDKNLIQQDAAFFCLEAVKRLAPDTELTLKQNAIRLQQQLNGGFLMELAGKKYTPLDWLNLAERQTPFKKVSENSQVNQAAHFFDILVKQHKTIRTEAPKTHQESLQDISVIADGYFKGEYTKAIKNYKANHSKPEEVMKSLGLFFAEKVLAPDSNKPVVNLQRTAAKLVQYYSAFSEDGGKNKEMGQFLQTSVQRLHQEAVRAGITTNPEANIQTLCADIGLKFMDSAYRDVKGKGLEESEVTALKELKIDPTSLAFQDMYLSRSKGANPLQDLRESVVSKLAQVDMSHEQKQQAISSINKLFDPDVFRHMQSLLFPAERTTWQDWNTSLDTINPSFREKVLPSALHFLKLPFSKENRLPLILVLSMLLPQLLGSLLKTEEGSGQQAQYQ